MAALHEVWLDRGWLPDAALRWGIRRQLAQRLIEAARFDQEAWAQSLRHAPLAFATDQANSQHYEVPTDFFLHCLGPRRKYSCAFYETGRESLAEAEEAMLAKTCAAAELADGQSILELGCGWGSLSLWMAERFPASRIVAVSNSRTQKEFIDREAAQHGFRNLEIRTANMVDFDPHQTFDRVVSVEMFEHMRNYEELLRRIAAWLHPGGLLFVHVFAHRQFAYPFNSQDPNDWMARYFFAGGQMPSADLLTRFQAELRLRDQTWIDGRHYARTCEDWLRNMDAHPDAIRPLFSACYGKGEETKWINRWRVFFLACAELFAYREGKEWGVCHYRFVK